MRVRFTRRALADVEHVRHYLAERSGPEATKRVLGRIEQSLASLATFPGRGRLGRVPGTRELVVRRTPFIVAYRIEGSEVQVLALVHHARRWPKSL